MNNHMYGGMNPGGGFLMMFCMLLFLGLLFFFLVKSGKLGGRGYHRGPWGPGPWGPGAQGQQGPQAEGKPAGQAQGWVGPWGPAPRPEDEALKVLADRLASGDITPDEYLARVSVLRQQG